MKKIIIGHSDYSREEMISEKAFGGFRFGVSPDTYLECIQTLENAGYFVKFETSFFRKIFGIGKYRVVAYCKSED
jgi:hypothetical protein